MNTAEIRQTEDAFQIPTYNKIPIALERGKGCTVWDTDGKAYLDFYGGHCVTLLGHCPEPVVRAVQDQLDKLVFYSNVAYSPTRAMTAERIAHAAPAGLRHAFFCNSGTEANETALKLARTHTGKSGILAFEGGFHGRTIGSLSTTWNPHYRDPYQAILPAASFLPFGDASAVEAHLEAHDDLAAIILEPIQSMAGIVEADVAFYQKLRALCDAHGVMLIFDEVQTGVWRTGTFSISEHYGISPDLITLAKSLGSGLPVGAVLASDAIAAKVKPGDHGTTFGGGMVSMAAVAATIAMIEEDGLNNRADAIYQAIHDGLSSHLEAVRGRGCLIGLVLDGPAKPVITQLREAGILVGGAVPSNVIRVMPPLIASDEEVSHFVETTRSILTPSPSVV